LTIFINNEAEKVELGQSLLNILSTFSLTNSFGIAVAINNKVIVKEEWANYFPKENDKILIIKASQGG
jgi:sulfur carrier protein